jgi:CRP/FNR family transcriptional regulator
MRAQGILASIPQPAFDRISCCMTSYRFPARHHLFVEGNPSGQVAAIRSGYVKLFRVSEAARAHVMSVAGPGFFLGYEALIGRPHEATVETLTPVEVCMARTEELAAQMKEFPEVATGLTAFLCQRIYDLETKAFQLGTLSTRARLALHLLAYRPAPRAAGAFEPPALSRQDLADMLGMAKETLIRQLAQLARRRLVHLAGNRISVLDAAALERFAAV